MQPPAGGLEKDIFEVGLAEMKMVAVELLSEFAKHFDVVGEEAQVVLDGIDPDRGWQGRTRQGGGDLALDDLDDIAFDLVPQEAARGALEDGLAAVHDDQLVAEGEGLFHVVRGQQDGRALLFELAELVPDQVADLGIQARGRLVEDQEARLVEQGAGDDQAAFHPAGQFSDIGVRLFRQLHEVQQFGDALAGRGRRQAIKLRVDPQVLGDIEFVVEVVLLRYDAGEKFDCQLVATWIEAEDVHRAGTLGAAATVEHLHHGRLAGAIGTQESEA